MEQRQSDESNQVHTSPTGESIPDLRPVDTPPAEPQQTSSPPADPELPDAAPAIPEASPQEVPAPEKPNQELPNAEERRESQPRQERNGNSQNQQGNRNQNQRENRQPNGQNGRDRQNNGNRPDNRQRNDPEAPAAERETKPAQNQRTEARPDRPNRNDVPRPRDTGGPEDQSGEQTNRDERLVIGISLGDYNGIGPEVILKALQYNRLQKLCTPVIYGSMRVLNRYRNLLDMKDWNLNGAPTIGQISHKMTNVITCWPDQNQDIQPGQVTPEAGQAAFDCLQRAVDDLKAGKLDALVTAPINKYNIQSEEFKFPGHTEFLAEQFGVQDNLMFMVSDTLRVGVVTGHVPLGRVRQNVTRDRIAQKLTLMMQSLKQDFGIAKPKIAVLGLNPHAGEEGLLGNEENDIIKPLLADWRNKGQLVFGPYPADGFFGTRSYAKFDAVLAMYHDQGLIPFKAIAFEEGVNFTAGMPVVRTSPDHGTAYDIAGKNLADETSMLRAIYTAIDVARQRKEYLELEANALK